MLARPSARRAPVLLVLLLALLVPTSAVAETALNVVPHGARPPGVPWASNTFLPADTQARMYDRITPLYRRITPDVLRPSTDGSGYFKTSKLVRADDPTLIWSQSISGTAPGGTAVSATIKRDAYGVPHIWSATDRGAIYAAGYVAATDQALLMNAARRSGVAGMIDLPGTSAIGLTLELYDYRPTQRVMREAAAQQTRAIRARGADGRRLLSDIDTYLAGANKRRAETGEARLSRTDLYALNAVKSQFLGEGGGEEVRNALLLDGLQRRLGARAGSAAYQDLRARNDPEAATTTNRRFPYQTTNPRPGRGRGEVQLREGSFRSAAVRLPGKDAKAAAAPPRTSPHQASNILIISGRRSATGRPLMVGGPQIGFNYPGLTYEVQIQSPSISVRGATSAPFPGYMLIGRGKDFGWSLTSAGVDIIDTYAETLCGGSRHRYRYRGRCRAMERVDAGTISKGGKTVRARFWRTVHGPVQGYARTRRGNRLVALATRRSSRGRETTDLLFNQRLTYGRVRSARDFVAAARQTPQTFNSFYASARESAMYTSGAFPLRPAGVNPDLPVSGDGRYEWRGMLSARRHPQIVNPRSGLIINWNNKPARDFPASDERFGNEGGLQRTLMLEREVARHGKLSLTDVLSAENAGASEDVRVVTFWPTLRRMLARGRAPSTRAARLAAIIERWRQRGGSRVDANRDGKVDDPGAAILDAAWTGIADAGLCDRLGRGGCLLLRDRLARFEPGGQYGGWHQYMDKDLRTILRRPVEGRYRLRYCGRGSASRCARAMWRAIDRAGARLAAQQGDDPQAWRAPEQWRTFGPVPLMRMHYSNKPTGIQQVLAFDP